MKKLLILNVLLLATVNLSAALGLASRKKANNMRRSALHQLQELERIENAVLSGQQITDLENSYFMFGDKIRKQALNALEEAKDVELIGTTEDPAFLEQLEKELQEMEDLAIAKIMEDSDLVPLSEIQNLVPIKKKSVRFGTPFEDVSFREYKEDAIPNTHFDPSKQPKSILKKR